MVSTLRKFFLTLCLLSPAWAPLAHAAPISDPLSGFFVTNGQVNAMVRVGGILYIGGAFTKVRPYTGFGVALDADPTHTGAEDPTFPRVNSTVHMVLPDGSGGWYIAGEFTDVGGVTRKRLAHIKSDKTVDPNWDPNASGPVRTMVISGSTMYIGGDFTCIGATDPSRCTLTGGTVRNHIAALKISDGTVDPNWDPNANGNVLALVLDGSTLYVGGLFAQDPLHPLLPSIGGAIRNFIAALDTTINTNNATAWDPNADARVNALALSGNTMYAGGNFANIGGQPRNFIAALKTSDGTATTWDASAMGGNVQGITVSGSTVYVGGGFNNIGGQPRINVGAVSASTGLATSWNPNANSTVRVILVSGSTVYLGGNFATLGGIGGQARNNIAAVDNTTGTALAWNPSVNGAVRTLALVGGTMYAGGEFDSAGGETLRNNIAAFDATTGVVLPAVDPNANGAVSALTNLGSTVYVGGDFTTVNGQARNHLAALDASTGIPTSWDPNANLSVRALAVSSDATTVFAGGDFTTIAGVPRNRIAALTVPSPVSAAAWNPCADNTVSVIAPAAASAGNKIYVAGSFTNLGGTPSGTTCTGGQPRAGLAFLKGTGTTGLVINWAPQPNGPVRSLLVGGTTTCTTNTGPAATVYLGGEFTCLDGGATPTCSGGGGFTRSRLAAVKSSGTGVVCDWNPGADNTVRALALSGNTLFVGGDLTNIGGFPRTRLAAVDATSGSATSWNPKANAAVLVLTLADSLGKVYAGGTFSAIAGSVPIVPGPALILPRNNVAAFAYNPLVSAVLPSSRSVQTNNTATAFATIINTGSTPATNVGIASNNTGLIPGSGFSFQATSPLSAALNTPVNIPAGGVQNFIISVTPTFAFLPTQFPFTFEGTNTTAARQINGLNTLLFSASDTPVADIVALASTTSGDGIIHIPGKTGAWVFAVATVNVGIGSPITATANTGIVTLPVTLTMCQTNPMTGACTNPLVPTPANTGVPLTIGAGETPTFVIFVTGTDTVALDAAVNRIFVEFHEGTITGPIRGSTSVAVCTHINGLPNGC